MKHQDTVKCWACDLLRVIQCPRDREVVSGVLVLTRLEFELADDLRN